MLLLMLTHGDGSNPIFQRFAKSLKNNGYNIKIIAWDRTSRFKKKRFENGTEFIYILRGGGYRNKLLFFWYIFWMVKLFLYLIIHNADLIWAANFETALPAALATLIKNTPFIYHIHDNLCLTYRIPIITEVLFSRLDKWAIKRAAQVIVPDRCRIEMHAMKYMDKIHILPNTLPLACGFLSNFCGLKMDYDIYLNGSILETRGVIQLLEAAKKVPECKILIAGRIPEKKIVDLVIGNSQVTYISTLNHRQALYMYSKAKAVFAFYDPTIPINRYACPTKFYEAMLMGKPIIINCETILSNKIIRADIGYSCRYSDIDGLANILRTISYNTDDVNKKGAKARLIFQKELAWEYFEPELLKIVEELE